ncbi:MAG: aspartate aminotransferase, partial [Candidatus Magasanikbacteria bacterium CG10_big_fil_rev_8_21_14_0_10_43_6]
MKFSTRLNIPPSETLAINTLANKKKAAGERVYNLSAGEPLVQTPPVIIDAAVAALQAEKTNYTPMAGILELRETASTWLNKQYGADFSVAETFVTNGGKFGLYALCQTLLNPGDEAIIIAPYWVSYAAMVQLAGGCPIVLHTKEEEQWKLDVGDLERSITQKTTCLILNNGSNPTGVLYTKEELQNILHVCAQRNILVISDEVYSGLVYDGHEYISCSSLGQYKDTVIVVHSMSKNFGMTGWRVGFVFGREALIQKLTTLQGQSTSNTASVSQWAAVAAFEHANDIIPSMQATLQSRRDIFFTEFERIFHYQLSLPPCGLYYFIPLTAFGVRETDSVAFCSRVLAEANVAMVPGAAFAMEGYVRCSFGVSEDEIIEALAA